MIKDKKTKQSGFLLVEMLVAVFIFTIVMLLGITSVLSILDANRKNQNMQSVINNLNLVINGMAKNIAVGNDYHCGDIGDYSGADCNGQGGDFDSPETSFAFTFNKDTNGDGDLDVIRYRLGAYEDPDFPEGIGNVERSVDGGDFVPITSPEVHIQSLNFYVFDTSTLDVDVSGNASGDENQPRVVVIIRGYAGKKENSATQFNLQTTISQRSLDVSYYENG